VATRVTRTTLRRRIVQIVSTLTISGLLVGCGGGSATPTVAPGGSSGTATQAPAGSAAGGLTGTLTISDWEFTEGVFADNVKKMLKTYEAARPGVTLNFQATSYNDYPTTIKTQIGAGGGPDVMVLLDQDFFQLQKAGSLAPLTSITDAQVATLRPANQTAVFGSDRMGYIWETVIYGYLYNKDLYQQAGISAPPTDFAGLLTDCKAIKDKTGKWGYAARNMTNEIGAWYEDFTGTWIIGYGGAWTDDAGKFTVNSAANIQAVTDFATLYSSGCFNTGVKASVFRPSFIAGDVATLMDNANAGYTYVTGGGLTDAQMGSGPLPFPTKFSGMQQLYLTINKNTKVAALAQDFMNWLMEPAQQQQLVEVTAPQTTASTVIPSDTFNQAHPWAMHYYSQADNGKSLLMNVRPELTNQLATTVMPFIEQVLAGQMSATDAMNAAQDAAVTAMGNP
jgi:multiple sugar transport system substrate-binding protein